MITRQALARVLAPLRTAGNQALVLRTTPNEPDKCTRRYDGESPAPFFTVEAARYLVELGIEHLLVDLPSIDRAHDGGALAGASRLLGVAGGQPQPRARGAAGRDRHGADLRAGRSRTDSIC